MDVVVDVDIDVVIFLASLLFCWRFPIPSSSPSLVGQIGVEVAQSNAAWLLDSGYCTSASVNGTDIGCEKR